jgi:predicted dehydrogenase
LGDPELYTEWQAFLRHPGLEAVLISTPHDLHYEQVRAALEHGLHVLVDKPLCLDAGEAQALVQLAQTQDRVLSVAYNYHYGGHFRAARDWIARGRLGAVTSATVLGAARGEGSPILDPASWYHTPDRAGGGSMISGGTHRLTALLWLTGLRPRSVYALMQGPAPALDLQAGLVLDLEGGAVATLLNEADGPAWRVEFSIYGQEGAVFIRNQDLEVQGPDGRVLAVEVPPDTDALADFYAAVVSGQPLLTSAADGYWAVAAVQAAYQSAAGGVAVPVRKPDVASEGIGGES